MNEGEVLRIVLANPVRLAFDAILRERLIPDLRRAAGVSDVWAARRGPGDLGERAIVSRWVTRAAMASAMAGDGELPGPGGDPLAETADRRVEVLPVRVAVVAPAGTGTTPTILRIARGRLAAVDMDTYAAHVAAGAERDRARDRGPSALILASAGDDRFVTVSAWRDWDAIAAATGASLERPVRTREEHELSDFQAVHYELLHIPA